MTEVQAVHLIEQFAAQAPFAIWITDARGVAIFANKKLHELFRIPNHPSGALGFNLFQDPGVGALGLEGLSRKAQAGEVVETILEIPDPSAVPTNVDAHREAPMTIKVTCYALRNSSQKIEQFVIIIDDVTETYAQREKLRAHLRDIAIHAKSKEMRKKKLEELEKDVAALEAEIKARGGDPDQDKA